MSHPDEALDCLEYLAPTGAHQPGAHVPPSPATQPVADSTTLAADVTPLTVDINPLPASPCTTAPPSPVVPVVPQQAVSPSPTEEHPVTLKELVTEGDPDEKYQTKRKVGEGAGGEIYLAMELGSSRDVAIKKMALTPQNMKMIANEVYIIKTSKHPNIVEFFECYIVEERLWVIMEYIVLSNFF